MKVLDKEFSNEADINPDWADDLWNVLRLRLVRGLLHDFKNQLTAINTLSESIRLTTNSQEADSRQKKNLINTSREAQSNLGALQELFQADDTHYRESDPPVLLSHAEKIILSVLPRTSLWETTPLPAPFVSPINPNRIIRSIIGTVAGFHAIPREDWSFKLSIESPPDPCIRILVQSRSQRVKLKQLLRSKDALILEKHIFWTRRAFSEAQKEVSADLIDDHSVELTFPLPSKSQNPEPSNPEETPSKLLLSYGMALPGQFDKYCQKEGLFHLPISDLSRLDKFISNGQDRPFIFALCLPSSKSLPEDSFWDALIERSNAQLVALINLKNSAEVPVLPDPFFTLPFSIDSSRQLAMQLVSLFPND